MVRRYETRGCVWALGFCIVVSNTCHIFVAPVLFCSPHLTTAWDRIDINDPNMTLNEFLEHIEAQYHCEVQMLSQGVTILHSFFFPPSKVNERKAMKLEDVAAQFSLKRPLTPNDKYLVFEVCACKADDYPAGSGDDDEEEDEDDDDLNLPYVRFKTSM